MRCLAALLASACGTVGGSHGRLPGEEPPPCPLASRWYAIDDLAFPETDAEWSAIEVDLDGDDQPDDALARAHAFFSQGIAIPSAERLRGLPSRWIVEVAECAQGDLDHARVGLHEGTVAGAEVELVTPGEVPAVGRRFGATVTADQGIASGPVPALFELEAAADGPWLEASGTAFRVDPTDAEVTGVLAFGVEAEGARAELAPRFALLYTAIYALDTDCTPTMGCSVLGAIALMLDDDGDKIVTTEELMRDFPTRFGQQVLVEDADLLSGGSYDPGDDGTLDSFSIAFAFHGTAVTVTPPP